MIEAKGLFDVFVPEFEYSEEWEQWMTLLSMFTCSYCWDMYGQIFRADDRPMETPPVHENCRCEIIPLLAVEAGSATTKAMKARITGFCNMAAYQITILLKKKHTHLVGENGKATFTKWHLAG